MTQTTQIFFELVRAGLFGHTDTTESTEKVSWEGVEWSEVYRLAEEQSIIGLIAEGIDRFKVQDSQDSQARMSDQRSSAGFKVPQEWALQFVGQTLQLEQRNKAMNAFVAQQVSEMRKAEIYTLLLKGQAVAQCYEKPLWRACGDVDFFLSDENYNKAKEYLIPKASATEPEGMYSKHLGMTIDGWAVELHGRLRCGFSSKADRVLDEIQNETFYGGNVNSWNNDGVQVFLLSKENEVFYVFTHFLGHFYKGGIGLRQICDWCRLLYTYRDSLNYGLLGKRIQKAGLVSEWRAFGALAVEYLGFPKDSMPLLNYDDNLDANLKKKAERIMEFILKTGNFGHNRDMSFYHEGSYLGQKVKSFGRRLGDMWNHFKIFPIDTLRFMPRIVWNGVRSAMRGE